MILMRILMQIACESSCKLYKLCMNSDTNNFAVNTDKFTVDSRTGDTFIAGTLDVSDNFIVNSETGDTVIAGTLEVLGVTTLSGGMDVITTLTNSIADINIKIDDIIKRLDNAGL